MVDFLFIFGYNLIKVNNSRKKVEGVKYITRNLENVVNQVTKEYPVVLVTGPRRVGKTTMLQKLMKVRIEDM